MWLPKHNGMAETSVGWAFTPKKDDGDYADSLCGLVGKASGTDGAWRAKASCRAFLFLICRREEGHQESITTFTRSGGYSKPLWERQPARQGGQSRRWLHTGWVGLE